MKEFLINIVCMIVLLVSGNIVAQGNGNGNYGGTYWCVEQTITDSIGSVTDKFNESNSAYPEMIINKNSLKYGKVMLTLTDSIVTEKKYPVGSLSFSGDTLIFLKDFGDPNNSYKETIKLLKKN